MAWKKFQKTTVTIPVHVKIILMVHIAVYQPVFGKFMKVIHKKRVVG